MWKCKALLVIRWYPVNNAENSFTSGTSNYNGFLPKSLRSFHFHKSFKSIKQISNPIKSKLTSLSWKPSILLTNYQVTSSIFKHGYRLRKWVGSFDVTGRWLQLANWASLMTVVGRTALCYAVVTFTSHLLCCVFSFL